MKKIKSVMMTLMTLVIMGCPDKDEYNTDIKLVIVNNSVEPIVEYRSYSIISDTLLQVSNPFVSNEFLELAHVLPGEKKTILEHSETIEKNGVLHIHLLSKDTLENIPWVRIRDENLVLRRYDLSLNDLEVLNWIVEYP